MDSFRACLGIKIFEDVFLTNQVQMGQNVVGRWRVGGGWQVPLIRSLVNVRDLELECASLA